MLNLNKDGIILKQHGQLLIFQQNIIIMEELLVFGLTL